MKKDRADYLWKLAFVAVAAFVVFNGSSVSGFLQNAFSFLQPVLIGVVLAMAMGVPLRFFEKKLFRKIRRPKRKEFLSVGLTFLVFGGAITALALLILPQGVRSVKDLLEKLATEDVDSLLSTVRGLDFLKPLLQKGADYIKPRIAEYAPKLLAFLQDVFTGLYNVLFGAVIAVMLILNRKTVKGQLVKLLTLLFPRKTAQAKDFLLRAAEKFSGYLGGQLTEAFILGGACYLMFSLLRVPYAALVSLIIGFMNLIPIFGAYIGGVVCGVIVFAAAPGKLLVFLAALLILQQIEGFTTYPIVVGKYVGLNGFWITVAIIVWGGLLGFWGLFLGVPFTAFVFDCLEKKVQKKEEETKLLSTLPQE